MSSREQARMRRLVDREVLGELQSRHRVRLHEHLRSDDAARDAYDRAIEAFRALEGRPVASMELDLVERWLFDEVPVPAEEVVPRRGRFWAILSVTAAAAAAAVLVLRSDLGEPVDDVMGIKAGPGVLGLAIEALCSGDRDDARLRAADDGCSRRGTLSFAYQVHPQAPVDAGVLSLFGIDARGEVSYYAPTPLDPGGFEVVAGDWQPLPLSIDVDVNHDAGAVRLYGIVTPVPLRVEDIDEAAAELRYQGAARPGDAPWPQRLGVGRIAKICGEPDVCLAAELAFEIYEDMP